MNPHLNNAVGDVLDELKNAFLDILSVFRVLDVVDEVIRKDPFRLLGIGEGKHSLLLLLAEDVIDVDADEDLDLLDVLQFRAELEVARGTEIAGHGLKGMKERPKIVRNTAQFLEERVAVLIRKELRRHLPSSILATPRKSATQFRRHKKACLVRDISSEARPSARNEISRTGTQTGYTRRA